MPTRVHDISPFSMTLLQNPDPYSLQVLAHVREKLRASVAAAGAAAARQVAAAASLETQRVALRALKARRNRRRSAAALLRDSWRNVDDAACLADIEVCKF